MSADDPTLVPSTIPVAAAPRAGMSALAKAGIATAVVIVLVVGAWLYGRSSTAPDRAAADAARLRMMLLESRAQVLDAQLSLYAANFGNAAQHLEYAKPPLTAASTELTRLGNVELATKADAALQQVTTARDLAAKLSLDANSKAGEASRLLGEVLSALPR
jgi:folate-binding Fe-S cluster repair protein YgfZ